MALGSHPVYNKMRVRTVGGSSRFYFLIYYTDASQTGSGMGGVGASNPDVYHNIECAHLHVYHEVTIPTN